MTLDQRDLQLSAPLAGLAEWACARISDDPTLLADLGRALAETTPNPAAPFGFEVHLDGSGRVDLAILTTGEEGRALDAGAGHLRLGVSDVIEVDRHPGGPVLAGVFHPVESWDPPASLAGFSTPALVSPMTGRDGQLRLILNVTDRDALQRLITELTAAGVPAETVAGLAKAAPLITDERSLRLGVDYLVEADRLGARAGLEVFLDPGTWDVYPTLAELGVAAADLDRLRSVVDTVPGRRGRRSAFRWAPDWLDTLSVLHFSVSWPAGPPVVKVYLLVSSGPLAPDPSYRVWLEGARWRDRLDWARRQLPLLAPDPDRLAAWATAVDPNGVGGFQRRLDLDGLTREQALVAVSPVGEVRIAEPKWWTWYQLAADACRTAARDEADDASWLAAMEALLTEPDHRIAFAHLFAPVVDEAWRRMVANRPMDLVSNQASADLRRWLLGRLAEVAASALNDLRTASWLFGKRVTALAGPEPDDAGRDEYASFCRRLAADGLNEVAVAYPVLPSLIATVIRQWSEAAGELLTRLQLDRADLARTLDLAQTAELTAVRTGTGDTHHDGRAVCILEFGGRKLVYKPRDVGLELLYHRAVALLNRLRPEAPLLAPATLPRDDGQPYGYVAFIEGRPCRDEAELASFYRNAGRTLALLYALGGTDCHMENLIASGDQLVLIDAETLLEVAGSPASRLDPAETPTGPVWSSVLQVGMLPGWLWMEGRKACLDISALGVPAGGEPREGIGWRAVNTDLMLRGKRRMTPEHPACLPTAPGETVDLARYQHDLADGFADMYRLLIDARSAGLADLVAATAGVRRRLVRRPTYVYATLLDQSVQPDALRSAHARSLVLERLTRAFLGEEKAGEQWPAMIAEQEAMSRLDVPYFWNNLGDARTCWDGGSMLVAEMSPAIPAVLERLAGLDEADLAWQQAVIHDAFAASRVRFDRGPATPRPQPRPLDPDVADAMIRHSLDAVVAAKRVAGDTAVWLGLRPLPADGKVTLQVTGSGLYEGRLGLAIGLLAGASNAGDAETAGSWTATAGEALKPLLELGDGDAAALVTADGIGMAGLGGLLRGLDFLRSHLGEAVTPAIRALTGALTVERIQRDQVLDHIGGAAGLITPLCRMLAEGDDPRLPDLVRAAAEHLVAAQEAGTGGWRTLPASAPLTGIAHGASGIALAVAEAAVSLGDEALLDAAIKGFAYEDSVFDETVGNWPDFRSNPELGPEGEQRFGMAWCTGGPGIALARLRLLELLPDHPLAGTWERQLRLAADAAAASQILPTDHLCCGNLGLSSILKFLAERCQQPAWAEAAAVTEQAVLTRPGEQLPRSQLGRTEIGIPMPGLLTGLPGAALALGSPVSAWVPKLLL